MKKSRIHRCNFYQWISSAILVVVLSVSTLSAQDRDIEIANEYFGAGEYDKAVDMYDRLSKKESNLPYIYSHYIESLLYFKRSEEAEKVIRKMIKLSEDNLRYRLDHYVLVRSMNGEAKSEKEFSGIVNDVKQSEILTEKTVDFLVKQELYDNAMNVLLASRKALKNNSLYTYMVASLYYKQGNAALAIGEMLEYLKNFPGELENIKNSFQNNLTLEKDFELLESTLYERVQQNPEDISYNELLLWLNLQKKNFSKAFMQAKAIDKRIGAQGAKLIEIGRIAFENRDFINATRFYEYVIKEYKDGANYPIARRELILTKEELIKATYPIDTLKIKSLILDYKVLINELGTNPATIDARRSMAQLYAFYLDDKDTAAIILNEAILLSRANLRSKCKAKIDLGDIYLLKGEHWESTLLYSQVEKDMVEDPLGHEAKLKNAKLSYYKGEFELAQAHLDVLKLATSREISNDAMELSIMIQDNTGLDSTTDAMGEYAAIDLLLFQNKTTEALEKTNAMMLKFPNHSLTDELYWLKSKIHLKTGANDEAIAALEKIGSLYPDDILGDNALFTLGIVYEERLRDSAKAMEIYQRFLTTYPASIYTVEARKRFRLLRGDKL